MKAILLFIKKLHQLWKSAAPKRIKLQTSTWAHFKELCLFFKMSLSWAQLLNFLGDTSSQSGKGICHFCENNIDFGRLSLLNELSYRPQFGLILKSCVCSLKWAQVEVICSICSGVTRFRSDFVRWKMLNLAFTTHLQKKIKLSKNHSVEHLFSSYFCFIYLNTMQIQ